MNAQIVRTGTNELTVVLRCNLVEAAEVARRLDDVQVTTETLPRDPAAAMLATGFKVRAELKRIAEASR